MIFQPHRRTARLGTVVSLVVTLVMQMLTPGIFSFTRFAQATTVSAVVDMGGVQNGFMPGAGIGLGVSMGVLRVQVTATSSSQTLDSVRVNFYGSGFTTTTLEDIATATSSGVALYKDTGFVSGMFDEGDQVITLATSTAWTDATSSIMLTPNILPTLTNGAPTIFFVAIKLRSSASNGTTIVPWVPANGVFTSDGTGPASSYTANHVTVDLSPPTVTRIDGFSGSATLQVHFNKPVQRFGGGPIIAGNTPFTYTDGGGSAQSISSITHTIGQDMVTLTMSGALDNEDVDGSPATLTVEANKVTDMSGNAVVSDTFLLSSPIGFTLPNFPTATSGTTYSVGSPLTTLTVSGGTPPYEFSFADITSSSTMSSIQLNLVPTGPNAGKIVGVASSTGGSYPVAFKVTDAVLASTTRMYTINVAGSSGGSVPGIASINPPGGIANTSNVFVRITGSNTSFTNSSNLQFLMPIGVAGTSGITITNSSSSNATTLNALIAIDAGASIGNRDVQITTGGQTVMMPNGFSVIASGGGSGLQLQFPSDEATGVTMPPAFTFTPSSNGSVTSYRVTVKTASDPSGTLAPIWDYAFPASGNHCTISQCNVMYGAGTYRIMTMPTPLAPNTNYYWQVRTYSAGAESVSNSLSPVDSSAQRKLTTTASVTDVTPPNIQHRPVFTLPTSAEAKLFARVFDNIAIPGGTPALTSNLILCGGAGCTPTSTITGTSIGAGYFTYVIPANLLGTGAVLRYKLTASDSTNSATFLSPSGEPFTITATASPGSATITGTVVTSTGLCPSGFEGAYVFAEGTGFSTTTRVTSCAFTLPVMNVGTYDLIAVKDGYSDRRIESIAQGSTGIEMRVASGFTGGSGGDVSRPHVIATGPMNNQNGVPGNDSNFKIFLGFDKAMSQNAITATGNLTVKEMNPATGGFTDISSNGSWTYYPTAPNIQGVPPMANVAVWSLSGSNTLGSNKTIAVIVGSGVTDSSGNTVFGNQPDGSYALMFNTSGNFTGSFGGGGSFGSGDFIPVHVIGTTPAPGSINIPRNTTVLVNFSDPMSADGSGYTLASNFQLFTVSGASETNVTSDAINTVTLNGDQAIATVALKGSYNSGTFAAGTRYRLKVLGGAKGSSGLTLAPPGSSSVVVYQSDFTTGSSSDTSAPLVKSSFPSPNQLGVPVNLSAVTLALDHDINPSTVNTQSVALAVGSTAVNGTVEYRPAERQIVFTPSRVLTANTAYILTLSTDIQALNGVALESAYSLSFTTGDADSTAPMITSINVDDHAIAVTFSEPMVAVSAVDTLNWPTSVLNPSVYATIKYGSAGFNPGGAGTSVSLTGARFTYDALTNTVIIENIASALSGAVGNELYLAVRTEGANALKDRAGNTINSTFANARATVRTSAMTGGNLLPGMTATGDAFGSRGGFVPGNFSSSTFGFAPPVEVRAFSPLVSQTSKYQIRVPLSQRIPSGGAVAVTFPTGFNVSGAKQDIQSPMRTDLNGPGSGTITFKCETNVAGGKSCASTANADDTGANQGGLADDGVVVYGQMVVIYLGGATNDGNDFLNIDIAGIVNPSVSRDPSTSGYSMDVKTKNGTTVLESFTSMPVYIQGGGSSASAITGTITATDNNKAGTAKVYIMSPQSGVLETTSVDFASSTTATYTFSSIPAGQYTIYTDREITLGSAGVGRLYYAGLSPQPLNVANASTSTFNFTISSNTSGGTNVTVDIDGPSNEPIDIFAGSPTGFKATQKTLDASAGAESFTVNLGNGTWQLGVGPQMPTGGMSGPPPAPSYVMPRPKTITISGSTCTIDGVVGCSASFTLTTASKTIKGTVQDGSGRVMVNADVFAYSPQGGFGTHASTNASGQFTLNVNEGMYTVGAFIPGMPPSKEVPVNVSSAEASYLFINGTTTGITPATALSTFIIKVAKPDYSISGKVTDGTNAMQGASVYGYRTDAPGHANTQTDSTGAYTLYVTNGTWNIGVFAPQYGNLTEQTVVVSGASVSNQDFAPSQTGTFYTVTGTVCKDANANSACNNGEGTAGAFVRIMGTNVFNETRTGSDGTYSLNVPAGSGFTLRAMVPGVGDLPSPASFNVAGNVENKNFIYGNTNTITISFSETVTQGFVDLRSLDGQGMGMGISSATNTTLSLPNGQYQVRVSIPGINIQPTNITATTGGTTYSSTTSMVTVNGDEGLTVTLPTLRTVSGTVTDGSAFVGDAWVEIVDPTTGIHAGTKSLTADGTFSIKVIDSSADYRVNAMKPGYVRTPSLLTVNGSGTSTLTLAMTNATVSIGGQVLIGSSGASNAFIRAEKIGGGFAGTQADANGNYTLPVTDGSWKLYAMTQGYAEAAYASNPIIVSGASLTGKNITLTQTITLDPPKSKPVTPATGGTVQDDVSGVTLTIPANALGSDSSAATLNVAETNSLPQSDSADPLSTGIEITATDGSGNRISTLNDDVTVEKMYTIAELASDASSDDSSINTYSEVNDLKMAYLDTTNGNTWVSLPTTLTFLDADQNVVTSTLVAEDLSGVAYVKVSANTTHFSTYAPVVSTDPSAASTPTGLAGTANGQSAVNLTWTAVNAATGYDLYRSTSLGGTYSRLGSEPTVSASSTTSYADSGLTVGTTYYYKISSINSGGESAASDAVSVTTASAGNSNGGGGGGGGGSAPAPVVTTPAPTITTSTVPTTLVATSTLATSTTAIPTSTWVPSVETSPTVTGTPASVSTPIPVKTVPAPLSPAEIALIKAVPFTGVPKNVFAPGQTVSFSYSYKNATKKTVDVRIIRILTDANGTAVWSSEGASKLRPGASWKKKATTTLSKKMGEGVYTMTTSVIDKKTKAVLGKNSFNVTVKKPPVKVVKPKAPVGKKK